MRAYIVSEDKGFLPAVHYLQQTPKGRGCEIALVKSIVHAAMRTVLSSVTGLKRADSVEDVEDALAPLCGQSEAHDITLELEKIFAEAFAHVDDIGDRVCEVEALQVPSTNGAERCVDGVEAQGVSFVDLPGIGRALASRLESAGITNPAELRRVGSVEAWRRIYCEDASFPPKWVFSFEAAIQGIPAHSIDPKRKQRLKSDVKAFVSKKERAA